jgi:hypothetical protein
MSFTRFLKDYGRFPLVLLYSYYRFAPIIP